MSFPRPCLSCLLLFHRQCSSSRANASLASGSNVLFEARGTALFPFGVPTSGFSRALFRDLSWKIERDQAWALVGSSASQLVDAALLGRARADPRGSIRWPFLEGRPAGQNLVDTAIRKVAFRTRLEAKNTLGDAGGFTDYTSRYGGIRAGDEEALTLQTHLLEYMAREIGTASLTEIDNVTKLLDVQHLLNMPLITLSNGQTRRARIARSLLSRPEMLVLEEPFTGLDTTHRASLAALLQQLHAAQAPHVLMTLRPQDPVPDLITHFVSMTPAGAIEYLGPRTAWNPPQAHVGPVKPSQLPAKGTRGKLLVSLQKVDIEGRTPVLRNVTWQIRAGERWLLKGHNGSGKTTLLSVILGDHPQSYSLGDSVSLFDRPRSRWATSQLQALIGHASPEINNAFPRRGGLSTREAIGTGFEAVFCFRPLTDEQAHSIAALATKLGKNRVWLDSPFVEQRAGDQSLALLMRALVKKAPLIVLDEPMAGMDDVTIANVHEYLETGLEPEQSLVLVTHYDEEVPPSVNRVLELADGRVVRRQ